MIEEIAAGLYRIEVPLPTLELQSVNSYFIRGTQRHLIVDTGMDSKNCMNAVNAALDALKINPEDVDFFITHYHGDHFGLVHRLLKHGSRVYISKTDAETIGKIGSGAMTRDIDRFIRLSGMPREEAKNIIPPDAGGPFRIDQGFPFIFIDDKDVLTVGDYRFECVATPGHSAGHICLYEAGKRILLSGDHILGDITPGIQARSAAVNPLSDYLKSLAKIYPLDVSMVLPGHRSMAKSCRERIEELKSHHHERAAAIVSILNGGEKTTYEVASQMSWNTGSDCWDAFPVLQKLFATGEAFAHLRYLEEEGTVAREVQGDILVYSVT